MDLYTKIIDGMPNFYLKHYLDVFLPNFKFILSTYTFTCVYYCFYCVYYYFYFFIILIIIEVLKNRY